MSNLIQILPNVYGVKMPMKYYDFLISNGSNMINFKINDGFNDDLAGQAINLGVFNTFKNDFKILGTITKDEISFDASEVVEKVDRNKYNLRSYESTPFKKYDDDFNQLRGSGGNGLPFYWKPEQSLRSALPEEIFFENPYPKPRQVAPDGMKWNDYIVKYQSAQENITEKLLILQRL